MTSHEKIKLITLGTITGAHGVHGRVKVKSYTEIPEAIATYSPLSDKIGTREFSLKVTGRLKELLLCEIAGITRREQAEALRGVELYIARERLPEPEEGHYIEDMIGLTVYLEDGTPYGTVKAFHNYGAGDILEILPTSGGETELVLFTEENFPSISNEGLAFRPPEILQAKATPETGES